MVDGSGHSTVQKEYSKPPPKHPYSRNNEHGKISSPTPVVKKRSVVPDRNVYKDSPSYYDGKTRKEPKKP